MARRNSNLLGLWMRLAAVAACWIWIAGCAANHPRAFSDAPAESTPGNPRLEQALAATLASTTATTPPVQPRQTPPAKAELKKPAKTAPEKPAPKPTIAFDPAPVGKVVKVNVERRFVVVRFPVGWMPSVNQPLSVSRNGTETGRLKVTGPQLDDSIVADLVNGECQPGDDVSAR